MEGTADIREVEDAAKVRGLSRVPPDPTRDGVPDFVGRPETSPTRARTPPDFDTILPFPTAIPQARLRVLHGLDAAFLSGASEVRAPSDPTHRPISNHPRGVPRFSTPDTPPPSSAHPRVPGPAGALRPHIRRSLRALPGPRRRPPGRRRRRRRRARAERVSLAAVRLAFCQHAASRRWLARQESLLHAARLRLGERPIPAPPQDDATLRAQPHAAPPNHRWVAFERATRLVSARAARRRRGGSPCRRARRRKSSPRTTPRKPPPRSRLPRDDSNTPPHPRRVRNARRRARLFVSLASWRPGRDEIERGYGGEVSPAARHVARGTEVRAETET